MGNATRCSCDTGDRQRSPQPTESAEDLLARGKALAAQKKFAEALPLYQRATQLAPHSFSAWANLGRAYDEIGAHRTAIDANDQALALDANQAGSGTTGVLR